MTLRQFDRPNAVILGNNPITLRTINAWNERFWAKQAALTAQRMTDPILYDVATRDMNSEAIRVTLRERKSLDQALIDAFNNVKVVRRDFAGAQRECRRRISRRGGLARKTDALQRLIQQLVRENLEMTRLSLWYRLKEELGHGIITAIDRKEIKFLRSNGRSKSAPVSGLKDRLHRAKQE